MIDHPIEEVFRHYTDHVGWSDWAGLGPVRLTREGSPERNGVGCVRAFARAGGLREEVTAFEPPHSMRYRISAGGFPLADHRGEVLFASEGRGTRVTWRVSFRSRIPLTGWALKRGISLIFGRILDGFARHLDRSPRS